MMPIDSFIKMATDHFKNSYLKNKQDREVKIKYYKCWLQDMDDLMRINQIDIKQFKIKLNETL
jgi:ribosomal protein S4